MKRKLSKERELSLHLESEIVEERTEENLLTLKKKKKRMVKFIQTYVLKHFVAALYD